MSLEGVGPLFENRWLLASGSAALGALATRVVAVLRGRVKVLEYTVSHDRVALSADDAIFGDVTATWQGNRMDNLYMSVVEVQNNTSKDLADVSFRIWTGETLLLTESVEIPGLRHLPPYTQEFAHAIAVPPGETPTTEQFRIYRHNRHYQLRAFNRGQRLLLRYLTSIPTVSEGHSVWVDLVHPGVSIAYRPVLPEIHGVAVKLALPLGLVACLAAIVLVGATVQNIWVAITATAIVGLLAQSIGALIFKGCRIAWRLLTH